MGELSLRSVQFRLHIASEIRPRSDHILEVGCLVRLRLLQHALVCANKTLNLTNSFVWCSHTLACVNNNLGVEVLDHSRLKS